MAPVTPTPFANLFAKFTPCCNISPLPVPAPNEAMLLTAFCNPTAPLNSSMAPVTALVNPPIGSAEFTN